MFGKGRTAAQMQGLVVCLPKGKSPIEPRDNRPITLLNKLLARIVANTSYPFNGQNSGVPGRNSFVAVAGTRDAIAYAEFKRKPSCILSVDFKAAFDEASHHSLFRLIKPYGYSGDLLTVTQARYDKSAFFCIGLCLLQ